MTAIRISGTIAEINRTLTLMRAVFDIQQTSEPYANRGSKIYRVYVTIKDPVVYGIPTY